jgi:tetratricopeptide (TPR) repeat protein
VPLLQFGWSDLRVVHDGRYKYIQAPRPELYDLATDPGEMANLAPAQTTRAATMRAALGKYLDAERAAVARAGGASAPAVAPEILEKLGALGYVGGAGSAETTTPGADPKDKVAEFRIANDLMREGLLRLHDGDYTQSAARFQAVLARKVSSFEVHFYLARALAGLKRHAEAVPHFEEAARRSPGFAAAWEGLARSQLAIGRKAEARAAYEKAAAVAPRDAGLQARLGEALRDLGAVDEAIRRQSAATELAPGIAAYWNSLGMTLGGNGRAAEAERAFREAARLDDKNARYAYNLGLILERQGRATEARPWYEKAAALDGTFAAARGKLSGR